MFKKKLFMQINFFYLMIWGDCKILFLSILSVLLFLSDTILFRFIFQSRRYFCTIFWTSVIYNIQINYNLQPVIFNLEVFKV